MIFNNNGYGFPECKGCPPMPPVKPPRHIAEQQRMQEIISAMARYAADCNGVAGVRIPVEWLEELADLNMEKM